MGLEALVTNLLYGLTISSALILIASGLSLIFGVVGVVNFAHGSFCMLGAYLGYALAAATGSFWGALVLAPAAVMAGAVVIERFGLRPLYGRNPLYQLLLTFALSLVFSNLVLWIWGGDTLSIAKPAYLGGFVSVAGIAYPKFRLFVLALAALLALALWLVLARTTWGAVLRAGLHNMELVEAFGVDTRRLVTAVFALGAGLAAVAGVIMGAMRNVNPEMDLDLITSALIVVVIGGLGSFRGAVAGSLILGVAESFGAQLVPGLAKFTMWIVAAAILLWRPEGLMKDA
ncbi:MAG: branched-chain amino acid ABC transporter permease [Candidatus Rokubacteria bacterium]|nr:branched-chain amino acid ABC transporter permease [Candidatus Rokubacteria bacterium]MBI2155284.1 branched-chain amino acid ABC transporter permease [Candidatus Rokubacteria bacterium]MBI2490534.1 branched-chain amino acid ABC transporter permease [Candidatus Rokubacteria bacterium]